MIGQTFNRFTIIGISNKTGNGKRKRKHYICQCICGKIKDVQHNHLVSNKTKSCGCLSIENAKSKAFIFKDKNLKIYRIYQNMLSRCYNSKIKAYQNYGGRGITVCDEWRKSFNTFFEDMGQPLFPKAQLDRINNGQLN